MILHFVVLRENHNVLARDFCGDHVTNIPPTANMAAGWE
jgi:hypothetical protein